MKTLPGTVASGDVVVTEYEQLRRLALDANAASRGVGFTLLLRRGMAAWMAACVEAAFAPRQPVPNGESLRVPTDLRGEVALVLATMAMAAPIEGGMAA